MLRVKQKKSYISASIMIAVILMSGNLLSAGMLQAGEEDKLIGNWRGVVMVNETPVGVDMKIESLKGQQETNKFHYSEPRACKVTPQFISEQGSRYWFALKSGTGNICRKLTGGNLVIELKSDNKTLTYEVISKDKSFTESGELKRE